MQRSSLLQNRVPASLCWTWGLAPVIWHSDLLLRAATCGALISQLPCCTKSAKKIRTAQFILHDLREDWPPALNRSFDCIVSAYVFHHFELYEKVLIIQSLVQERLNPGGRLVIGDIAFPNRIALEQVKAGTGDEWEEEFYWLADEFLSAVEGVGLQVAYQQVSSSAGVFIISSAQWNNKD